MTSKSSSKRFAAGCGIKAAILVASAFSATAQPRPAVALLDAADASEWKSQTSSAGWQVVAPPAAAGINLDQRVQTLATAVKEAIQTGSVDANRVYVAGRGDWAAGVFYAISRVPDLWAAGIALGGSPGAAVDTDRIYAANFKNVPVLWATATASDEAAAKKWKAAGLNLEWRAAATLSNVAVFEWAGHHVRSSAPLEIDCETNSPNFASCFWVQMTKFDAGERNEVIGSTRLPATSRAALALGEFGYQLDDPGPGVLVNSLPPKYDGPLKLGDRIVQLDGKPIESARAFAELMAKVTEERGAVVMVQRGEKDRLRIETNILVPRRENVVTARVQAKYLPEEKEIQIISRTVKEMRVTVPAEWEKSTLNWNGLGMDTEAVGCVLLTIDKELMHASRCP